MQHRSQTLLLLALLSTARIKLTRRVIASNTMPMHVGCYRGLAMLRRGSFLVLLLDYKYCNLPTLPTQHRPSSLFELGCFKPQPLLLRPSVFIAVMVLTASISISLRARPCLGPRLAAVSEWPIFRHHLLLVLLAAVGSVGTMLVSE